MRIAATEDGVDLDDLALEIERLEVVRDRHQIGLGRQLVGRAAPVGIGERPELAGFDKALEARLGVAEITRRGLGPAGNTLLQLRGRPGIGLQRTDHVDPVERMQVIEMHQMVLGILRQHHQVADMVGVRGNLNTQGILDGTHRGQCMHPGTDTADTFGEGPGVARIAPLQYDLKATPHGTGRHGIADHIVVVDVDLDA